MRLNAPLLIALMVTVLTAGCFEQKTSMAQMPEVNDENCKHENLLRLPEEIRKKMGSACFKRSKFVPSEPMKW